MGIGTSNLPTKFEANPTDPLSCGLVSFSDIHIRKHLPAALPSVQDWQDFSLFAVLGLPEDERPLSDLRPAFQP